MQDFPPKFSKVLVTPDPQYIPGYAGYCPQLKFNLGKTYGQLTAELLTSPDVARSHSLVLNNARRPRQEQSVTVVMPTSRRAGPRGELRTCWPGGRRHMEHMTPGYTGFVPRSQNYFAHTYAETCREALTEFQCTQKGGAKLNVYDLPPISKKQGILDVKPWKLNTPLPAIAREPAPYVPQDPFKPRGSPYNMDNTSAHKYFISGYTGYVPKSRFLIGSGYPITTNKALVEFSHDQSLAHAPAATVRLSGDRPVATATIYHSRKGLLPSYTGHVPGYKFRYGQTFGQLTHNTLGGADIKRNVSSQCVSSQ